MNYKKLNNLLGWVCGLIASTVYIMTTEAFTSWWDTGEFIASAYKLEVVHQPGAPLFLMLQNVFSNFALGDVAKIALWMNIGSAICSGMTIVFLFWTITAIAKKILQPQDDNQPNWKVFAAGLIGALGYSFTDTFWYSAVESEVYAMSSLCTAAVFWLALKWEKRADEEDANRWLLLIAYVMGLSIGVHLLNLLTIPALALFIYFRKNESINLQGVLKSLGLGVLILAFILWGVIQYSVKIAASFDLFFVNNLGLPFGLGIGLFIALLIAGLVYGIYYSIRAQKPLLNATLLSVCFILLGFSSYSMLIIRSKTNISLNNNSPDNAFSFLGYLSREQYGKEPLFKGPTYQSKVIGVEETYSYRKDSEKYTKIKDGGTYRYDKEMLFPRVYSEKHAPYYAQYLGLNPGVYPTMSDNLKFFFNYQLNHMYTRYFMWNFVGRQNDQPGQGSYTEGNWLSGIKWLDNLRLGGQEALSSHHLQNPARNAYFFLPFILGLVGLFWMYKHNKRDAWIIGLLFFFTGIAIVIYLNQTPLQPRERDYAYAGSFYVFAIWIGLGVLGLIELLQRKFSAKIATSISFAGCLLAVPVLLVIQNWDDHDRSDRVMTRDLAYNYLASCEPNAILFTYADNDTFPIWYLQEVEGVRTDVRVVNLSYLQSDWYVKQNLKDINQARALPIRFDVSKVDKGIRDVVYAMDFGVEKHVDIQEILQIVLSDDPNDKVQLQNGDFTNVLPTKKFQLKVDRDSAIRNQVVPKDWIAHIPEVMKWQLNKDYITRADISLLEIVAENNWERPIYFVNMMPSEQKIGLEKYLVSEGLVDRLMPVDIGQPENEISVVNLDTLHRNVTQKFKWSSIRNLNYFDTDSNFIYENAYMPMLFIKGLEMAKQQNNQKIMHDLALIAYEQMPKHIKSPKQAYFNSVVADSLMSGKEDQKASDLINRNLSFLDEELHYQLAVLADKGTGVDTYNLQFATHALNNYDKLVQRSDDPILKQRSKQMTQKYSALFE